MDFINDMSTETVFDLIKQYYRESTGKEMQIGSDEFAISAVIAYIFGVLVQKFNAQAKQRYLSTATGEYLDALGETFNLPRPGPIHASCSVNVEVDDSVALVPGQFIIADDNGIQFTPAEIVEDALELYLSGVPILFVGYDNENVLDENNIEVGKITNILTPMPGIVLSVSNTTVTGGAKDEYTYTDEGDELYRQYIIAKRSAVSAGGPAAAYEQRAKEADGRVLDAYCLRYGDAGFVEGRARVYVLVNLTSSEEESEVMERVRIALTDNAWKPVCDTVEIFMAEQSMIYPAFTVGLSAKNAVSGRAKFEKDVRDYCEYLMTHLGEPFSLSELCRRAQTPDENGVKTEYVSVVDPMYNYVAIEKTWSFRRIDWSVNYETV